MHTAPEPSLLGGDHMIRIVGGLGMGFLFLSISPALRAKFLDGLAVVATAVDQAGVFAYVGSGIMIVGGVLIILTSGPESQANDDYIVVKRKSSRARAKDTKPSNSI